MTKTAAGEWIIYFLLSLSLATGIVGFFIGHFRSTFLIAVVLLIAAWATLIKSLEQIQ